MPMDICQLEVSNIRFGKLFEERRTPSPKLAFITYKDDTTRLIAITPDFINGDLRASPRGTLLQDIGRERSPRCHVATRTSSTMTRSTTYQLRRATTSSRRSTTTWVAASVECWCSARRTPINTSTSRSCAQSSSPRIPRTTSNRPTRYSIWIWHTATNRRRSRSTIRKTESERRSR